MAVSISATSDALFRRSLPMIHPKFRSSFLTRVDLSQARWLRLARPSLFFALTIYYEELFLKLYCFRAIPPTSALFTLLFTIPVALLLGLLCGGVSLRRGRVLLPLCTGLVSLWLGAQAIYYRLFKTFLTIFSLTKMAMVAGAFGNMAVSEVLVNWFPVLMMALPVVLSVLLRKKLIPDEPLVKRQRLRWAAMAVALQLLFMGAVLCYGGGVMSLRYIYYQAATPELEAQYFGMLTQTQLEIRRVLFGIKPDDPAQHHLTKWTRPISERPYTQLPSTPDYSPDVYHVMDIDFDAMIRNEEDEDLLAAHRWFSQRTPSTKNEWTGRFAGKNLIWIVAEGFSTLAMDPVRTPTLWQLSHQGFIFQNFYTPLWGVSTSDGEYVTTTGLIPKSGVWSYSQSSQNYMPFALGTQFRKQGFRTMAFHDYLYDYYDRNLSHPNMGYEYVAMGQGLTEEDIIPAQFLAAENAFPPSDRMMMEKIVPMFVNEDRFMVYCLTVSGHLRYNLEENAMSVLHWDEVKDLPYSDPVKCYLASQMELELAMESLVSQLEAAGRLEDTVIVLSADHYPYGLTDEEYSELLGHPVDPVFEIYENTLILWSADMEEPVYVEKPCSSLDVMPTLSNLFGLEFDSRLVIGTDILSDSPGLVIFSNYSFLNQEGAYNSITDQFTRWDGQSPDLDRVTAMVADVQNRVAYSAVILDYDYYRLALNGPPKEEAFPPSS
ncbi:LTA synthase family protein [Pseudoflavonifractor phocaeensis]|uniref:LTA synthase family protein n=1 Tax=Pseudoflavonifractor phocaeensis TaxID=1870988 RepID=UPI001F26DA7A|nr:alkaline phosphatase family protein [Pseudoflavonifractor phocaeensis]MCF2596833.1 sulfatase-like hydrolase/transferase [Pseudoflavonifractor phocaeensis]